MNPGRYGVVFEMRLLETTGGVVSGNVAAVPKVLGSDSWSVKRARDTPPEALPEPPTTYPPTTAASRSAPSLARGMGSSPCTTGFLRQCRGSRGGHVLEQREADERGGEERDNGKEPGP